MRTILITIAFGAATLAATVSASADDSVEAAASPSPGPTWELRTWMSQRWLASSSASVLTEDALVGGGAAVERRVLTIGLPGPLPVLDITTELGFDSASSKGQTFQQLDNEISSWQLTAGARARLPLRSWLHVVGRADVGGGRTSVRIADGAMSEIAVADRGATMVASTGLALAVLPRLSGVDSRGFFLGFELELGYQVATATTIRAIPEDRPEPELTIPASYASLGDLDLDGVTLRIGAVVGF